MADVTISQRAKFISLASHRELKQIVKSFNGKNLDQKIELKYSFDATFEDVKSSITPNVEILHMICHCGENSIYLLSSKDHNALEKVSPEELNSIICDSNIKCIVAPSIESKVASKIQMPLIHWQGKGYPTNSECNDFSGNFYEKLFSGSTLKGAFIEANRNHRISSNSEKDKFAFSNNTIEREFKIPE